jgi:hypothetical protein
MLQTTIALGRRHCLLCEPGPARVGRTSVGPELVRDINLRTYGWAQRFIYATSQEVVTEVRRDARKRRPKVVRPRAPRPVILEDADPNDPDVGRENVKRGWPKGLWAKDDDGQMRFVAYTVLEPDDPRSVLAAATGGDIGQRVIERAIAEGDAAPDRLDPRGATARQATTQKSGDTKSGGADRS